MKSFFYLILGYFYLGIILFRLLYLKNPKPSFGISGSPIASFKFQFFIYLLLFIYFLNSMNLIDYLFTFKFKKSYFEIFIYKIHHFEVCLFFKKTKIFLNQFFKEFPIGYMLIRKLQEHHYMNLINFNARLQYSKDILLKFLKLVKYLSIRFYLIEDRVNIQYRDIKICLQIFFIIFYFYLFLIYWDL